MNNLPNEIIFYILEFTSQEFIGFARVSTLFNSFFEKLKNKQLENCFNSCNPFILFSTIPIRKIFKQACLLNKKFIINFYTDKNKINYWNQKNNLFQNKYKKLIYFVNNVEDCNWNLGLR